MDRNDRTAIEGLFGKLGQAAQAQPHRDPEAEALIADLMARSPGAAYYLAQTVIMQEQALHAAEAQQAAQPQSQSGGLLGRLFGGGQPQLARPVVRHAAAQAHDSATQAYGQAPRAYGQTPQGQAPRQGSGPWNSGRPAGGGGFMAGAAQTAMGVAGGVLLGNAISGMFAGPADAAGTEGDPAPDEQAGYDEAGYDDAGFDEGGFEE